MEKLVIISLVIIVLILITRIRFELIKPFNKMPTIKIYFFSKLGFKINIIKLLEKYQVNDLSKRYKHINDDIASLFENNKFLKDLLKISRVRKIDIRVNYSFLEYQNIYIYFVLWNVLSIFKYIFDKYTKKVNHEYYNVNICQNTNGLYIYLDVTFPLSLLILTVLKNIKTIIRGIRKHGTSNKRTSQVIS